MLIATFLFALMAVLIKYAAADYSVFEIIFYRSIFGVICCWVLLKRARIPIATRCPWRHLIRCLIGTTCISLGVYILAVMPIATAQTLNYTSPLWFCLFLSVANLLSHQRPDRPMLSAVLIGFGGVLLILRPDMQIGAFDAAMGILAGLTGGAADFMIRNLSQHREPRERIVFFFTLSGTVLGFAASLWTGFSALTPTGIALILGIGLTGTLAQLALTTAWSRGQPLLNSVFQFAGILFAIAFGMLLWGDRLDALSVLGIAVVTGAGIAASLLRLRSERRAAKAKE